MSVARPASFNAPRPPIVAEVLEIVARTFDVPIEEVICEPRGSRAVTLARQVAMYILVVDLEFTRNAAGDALFRDRTTVGHALGRIEDRRDDPTFDKRLTRLEARMARVRRSLSRTARRRSCSIPEVRAAA